MIGALRGPVTHIGQEFVLIELGGVGYRVMAGPSLLARLRLGSEAHVFVHHLVREDQQALFGFGSPEELAFFELLMTVSGVGPRLALAITSAHAVTKLQLAIVTDDADLLTSVSGVGRKTALRIILELKEKIHAAGIAAGGGSTTDSDVVAAGGPRPRSPHTVRSPAARAGWTCASRPLCRSSRARDDPGHPRGLA